VRERSALLGLLRCCFARTQTWLAAGKYLNALVSDLPSRNGWSVAEQAGDLSPARAQRLLNRASWDEAKAMSLVRVYAAAGLDDAARRSRRRRMTVAALDETGQEKQGSAAAGVKRQYMGCAGRVANGINTVHLSYVREKTGHALAGARQWIPAEQVADPVKSLVTGLPPGLRFRSKGQLAIDILADAFADGLSFDFACGDEVYGSCTQLREFLEGRGQAYVLRVASSFTLTLAAGTVASCADAVKKLLRGKRGWEVRSAGKGARGERWYAWAWLATASPRHSLLVRRHLKTGELAFTTASSPRGRPRPRPSWSGPPGCGGRPRKASSWPRTASAWTSARPASTPQSCATSSWSWRFRGLRRHCRDATGPHRYPGPAAGRPGHRAARRSRPGPAHRPGKSAGCSPARSPARNQAPTLSTGLNGDAATRHDPAGSTNMHACSATTPWSASHWRLPY
jgi:hypothetical protein